MSEAARLKTCTGTSSSFTGVGMGTTSCHHGNENDGLDPASDVDELEKAAAKISMKKALEIDLILHATLASLDFPDLRTCRLVNKNWGVISSKIIVRRDSAVVMLKFDRKEKDFRRSSFTDRMYQVADTDFQLDPKLSALNKILSHSMSFPCTNLLINGGNLADEDIQKFLEIMGPNIKTLYLAGEYVYDVGDTTEQSVFRHFVQEQVPNVEKLTIGHFSYDWPTSSSSSNKQSLTLPSLRQLSWKGNPWHSILGLDISATAGVIMRGSPGLHTVHDFVLQNDLDLLLQHGRPDMIQCLRIQLDFLRPLIPALEKLLGIAIGGDCKATVKSGHLKLKKLIFENRRCLPHLVLIFNEDPLTSEDRFRFLSLLKKLFEACADTLEYLELFSLFSDLEGAVLAPLKNLKKLKPGHICYRGPHSEHVFPRHLTLTHLFPNLRTLDCSNLGCHDDSKWAASFPNDGDGDGGIFEPENVLPTVETLEFKEFATILWMQKLSILCPNFKKVVIQEAGFDLRVQSGNQKHLDRLRAFGQRVQIDVFLRNIFDTWRHLQALEIQVINLSPIRSHCLDAIFSGISEKDCQMIWLADVNTKNLTNKLDSDSGSVDENFEKFRTQPSICNLAELKTLNISIGPGLQQTFSRMVDVYTTNGEAPPLSRLAAIYAFNLIPDLKVRIQFDHNHCRTTPMTKAIFASISPYVNICHKKNL